MFDSLETPVLAVVRETLIGHTRLDQHLALIEPTRKLAQLLAGSGASSLETPLSSTGMPPGFSLHCSREISGAQGTSKGDCRYATPSLPV